MKSFSAKSSRTLNPLWVVIVGGMSVVFSHSVSWVWWRRLVFGCSSLWLGVIYVLHIMIYILYYFVNSIFLVVILVNCFRKSVFVLVQLFSKATHPWVPLVKNIVCSQSVDVAQCVRPAIEHAQDVLSGGLGQEWEYVFMLFLWEVLLCANILCSIFFWFFFCYFGCVLFSKIKLFLVWVCLATFWCFIISFLDLVTVFKRINCPVLSRFNPVWVP